MEIETLATILTLYIHAPSGGVALLSGAIALIAIKGSLIHKQSGRLFFYSMLISAIAAFVISVLPNHESPFLFSIGLFSTYFLISGLRSLRFKQREYHLKTDKIIAYLIILIGLCMFIYPVLIFGKINIVFGVFGWVGLGFGYRDLKIFKEPERLRKSWLKLHLGKMTGGYIAAVSAFFVVNQILPELWNWFAPGVLGSLYISYWIRKQNKKNAAP
ncbi:MAG: DUF2306 domain-containing protein [Flavobacteriaceae bacterium]